VTDAWLEVPNSSKLGAQQTKKSIVMVTAVAAPNNNQPMIEHISYIP
jgi:hypothetical protein